jgi:DNA replication protein DnaC
MTDTADPVAAQVEHLATELRLPTVRKMHRRLAREVSQQGGDYTAYLAALLREEVDQRRTRRVERRLKEAHVPQAKLLTDLDFTADAMPSRDLVMDLAQGHYIRDGRNVIAIGNPGTGKTHLATGLAIKAGRQGLRVRFYPVATLTAELEAAQSDHQLHRFLNRFGGWDLVVLDELGYLPLSQTGAELLFQAISERHERNSLIVTTNLPFTDWSEVFHTKRLTVALLDRITYRATILEMSGPSYRLRMSHAHLEAPADDGPDE